MALLLRDYQLDLMHRARLEMQAGRRRILLQLPTGGGKTVVIAQMLATAAARGRRAWFCVHRKELLDQSVTTFIEAADIHTGILGAGYHATPLAPVQVCSIPSLAKRLGALASPDMIVYDECHHLASRTWTDIAGAFPNAVQIGLSATPQRLDGQGLGPYFDALLLGPTTAQLIRSGHLCDYKLFAPGASLQLDGLHHVGGDYNKREVAAKMDASTVVGDAVGHYLAHGEGGRALVFAWNLKASRDIAASFEAAGVPAAHVDGETKKADRTAAMARFRAGELRVLCNVDLFGEGLDVPAVDNVFLLRPTDSLGLYLQQVGRGLRTASGKRFVRIFDHVNNWSRHGLPDAERSWSLEGRPKGAKPEVLGLRRCLKCFGVSPMGARLCRLCGAPFPVEAREVAQVAGHLQEADVDALRSLGLAGPVVRDRKPSTLAEWQALGKLKGYRPGWAWRQFNDHRKRA